MKQYGDIRRINKSKAEARKNEVYKQVPRIEIIDKQLSLTGLKVAKAVFDGSIGDKRQYVKDLQKATERLNAEKAALLEANGYAEDYLREFFSCSSCKDTGFVAGQKCDCYTKKLINRHFEKSGLRSRAQTERFDTFRIDFYPEEPDKKFGISPRANMRNIFDYCKRYCENFSDDAESLYLYGSTGLGKTFLCNCIANDILAKGKSVFYLSSFKLFEIFENQISWNESKEDLSELYELIFNCDLLIIDDLGTEFSTKITDSEFFNIINIRQNNSKPVIVSTNLGQLDVIDRYSERIASRIFGCYMLLHFVGSDIREKNKYKQ